MDGCTHPKAVNYNPAATVNDGSCVFLNSYNGVCYSFTPAADQGTEESYTLSYSFDGQHWVFFHDYFADFYFSSKNALFSLKDNKVYKHNIGGPGRYYGANPTTKSFFIDLVVRNEQEFILNSLQWITEVLTGDDVSVEFSTLTHITAWNSQQCTGRIAIGDVFKDLEYDRRKTQGVWSFNALRDLATNPDFLRNLFENYDVDPSGISQAKPWFDRDVIRDNWCIIRLEYDNVAQSKLILHEAEVNANPSPR